MGKRMGEKNRMKFMFLGHYILGGSGYTEILKQLGYGLTDRGHQVKIIAINYDKRWHNYPFDLVPIQSKWSVEVLRVLPKEWGADRVIIAEDIPKLHAIYSKFEQEGEKSTVWNFEALFPVESVPIKSTWRKSVAQFKKRYVISKFGADALNSYGIPTLHLPVASSAGTAPKSKEEVRGHLNLPKDAKIYITVADNQERKALPLAMEAFSLLPNDNSYYILVTEPNNVIGWDLNELREEYNIISNSRIVQRGISQPELSMYYWASDALVVPSQAEGACMPIYEAAAHGIPVICGDWTAMLDIIDQPWVICAEAEYVDKNPWGNVTRWHMSVADLAARMHDVYCMKPKMYKELSVAAIEFSKTRTWESAINMVENDNA